MAFFLRGLLYRLNLNIIFEFFIFLQFFRSSIRSFYIFRTLKGFERDSTHFKTSKIINQWSIYFQLLYLFATTIMLVYHWFWQPHRWWVHGALWKFRTKNFLLKICQAWLYLIFTSRVNSSETICLLQTVFIFSVNLWTRINV